MGIYILNISSCIKAAKERIPRSLHKSVTGGETTNLPGADLNAACSGPERARLMDGPRNKANAYAA
ncbi:hypothetical protein FDX20_10715 [Citrobacter sp. TBCS-11]|nr:hypothetical protein EY918_10350 [Citrobacter braakii]TKV33481.1 hypothetical protein FDX20_10715 [Citrobacter sp. TBCS-11]